MTQLTKYLLFFLICFIFFSCKKANLNDNQIRVKEVIYPVDSSLKDAFIFDEVTSSIIRASDYDLKHNIQKLDIKYHSLFLKIRYISDRAYISVENKNSELISWEPFQINFYYDMSFQNAEKDIHILLKDNNTSSGYLLFPAFTEQYSTYFVYHFKKDELIFEGLYELPEFIKKEKFYFDEKLKEVYVLSQGKKVKLNKIQNNEEENFSNTQKDLKLLNEKETAKSNSLSIEKYINDDNYFIKTFDINKDGFMDKIVSSKPYQGDELLIFFGDKNNNYNFFLKTINFSEDGGNQISDIKQTNDGFEIITRFPDKGESQSNYYIANFNNSFILKKIVAEYYSWQDKYTENCVWNINFDLKNSSESLSNTILKTQKKCTKKYDK